MCRNSCSFDVLDVPIACLQSRPTTCDDIFCFVLTLIPVCTVRYRDILRNDSILLVLFDGAFDLIVERYDTVSVLQSAPFCALNHDKIDTTLSSTCTLLQGKAE